MTWDQIYDFFGIRDFIYFISSSELQRDLLPIKLGFIAFAIFFLVMVIYFYINSSYIQYKFLQDFMEFVAWQPYGLRQITKTWQKIVDKIRSGTEAEYKLAIIEADDFLSNTLEEKGYEGETFEELLKSARKKILPSYQEILLAHQLRNSIVYDPGYKLDVESAKKTLVNYEKAVKNI